MPKKKRPVNDPIASDADASIEVQVDEILRKLGDRRYEWLLITQQLIFPCEAHLHDSRESLVGDMSDALMCGCSIAAIYHHGRLLFDEEIVPLRAAATDNLGPIARAKVDGLF